MSAGILTRWPVSQEFVVSTEDLGPGASLTDEAALRWFTTVWGRYLERSSVLRGRLKQGDIRVSIGPLRWTTRLELAAGGAVSVAIATTELLPSSFELAIRVRPLGAASGIALDGRCLVAVLDPLTDTALPVPEEVRREMIAVQAAASEYC